MVEKTEDTKAKWAGRAETIRIICFLAALIAAATALFVSIFGKYNNAILYAERQNQMKEVTTQLFSGLEDVTKGKWRNTKVQCRYLVDEAPQTVEQLLAFMDRQYQLGDMSTERSSLVAVDSNGRYYTQTGRKGLLTEQRYLLTQPQRLSFVSNSMFGNMAQMVYLQKLSQPLTLADDSDTAEITYYGIAQDIGELSPYFSCKAYNGTNGMYVMDEQGLKIFSDSPDNKLKGYNIYSILGQMEYLHGSSFTQTREDLESNGLAYSNAMLDGEEYYYALYRMENAAWVLLFTVPSRYVAINTVNLVHTSLNIILVFAFIMICACAGLTYWLLSRQQKQAVALERQNSVQLEAALKKAEKAEQAAKDASKAKSEFLSNMSHDIRTPMNAIVGLTKLMEHEENDPEKMDAYIHKVQASSQHLLGLINDVLDMSRIESSEVTLNREPIRLAEQVAQVDSIIRPQTQEHGQRFVIRAKEIVHEYLIGDSVRLRQIFINLLSNAVKYTPNGGTIILELAELECNEPGYTNFRIRVSDTGCGMSPEFVKHVFEPFTRAENSTTNKIQGTGLGMAITKNIVDLKGGSISVQSEVGKGSTFEVLLPFAVDETASREIDAERLLVITEEAQFARDVCAALRESAVQTAVASTESEARGHVQKMKPDVILLGKGFVSRGAVDSVRRQLKETGSQAMVLCCGFIQSEQEQQLYARTGADGVVPRPFFFENLRRAVSKAHGDAVQQTADSAGLADMRFLCAEDNGLNAEILTALMDMEGASCTIYPNGEELVKVFASVQPGEYDAILMDVQMPVMNGLDATRAIRSGKNPLGKTIPIIAMTANAFSSDVQDCLEAGMDAHVAKPLDISALERTLKDVLGRNASGGGHLYASKRRTGK